MKRILSAVLCAVMLLGVLASCTTLVGEDKGMIIGVSITTELFDFDPALHFNDDAMVKIYDLIYEGLTDLDENGKWQKALMKSYEIKGNDEDGYSMLIRLNSTRWTDGRTVQAADFVYAWKRILDPEFMSEAAPLLYDIKNARAVKLGDASIDDLGVAAVDTYVLQIEFETKIDFDLFLETLASPALVPLREDIVSRDVNWAKQSSTLVTNGPFAIKELTNGTSMRLERSSYYYLDAEDETQALDTYVIPYRLMTDYTGGAEAALARFEAGELFYIDEIPLSARAKYAGTATITDELATHAYVFNENNKLFADARVRRALSMAIDRNAVVQAITFAKPATGLIPAPVFDGTNKTFFRAVGGDVISASADASGAKSLLQQAGVTSGSFTITIRANEVDRAIANCVQSAWNALGFNVTVKELTSTKLPEYDKAYSDDFQTAYMSGDFDVIGIDLQMLSSDAFGALAPFATEFSGRGVDMNSENYDVKGHISGYASEEYDAIIEEAFAEKDRAARAAILHRAESKLMEDMPVCPIVFLQDAYLIHGELSGYKSTYYATRDFKRMKLKDYTKYLPEEETEAAPGADTTAAG